MSAQTFNMSLFSRSTPSFADEQLSYHLSSLATQPVTVSAQSTSSSAGPSPRLQTALHDLSHMRPIKRYKLESILRDLQGPRPASEGYAIENEVDRAMEAEVLARAVTMVWKEVLQVLLTGCLKLEEERSWWETSLMNPRGVVIYLVQSESHQIERDDPR